MITPISNFSDHQTESLCFLSNQRDFHRVQWTFFFLGARVTFGVSELSGVVVVVATKLEPVSKNVGGVVEPDCVLKSVADKFCVNWLAVGSEPKFHASLSSEKGETETVSFPGVRIAPGSEVGIETHPGVGGGDSGACGRSHKSARSLQARNTSNLFSKKGTQSHSYLYRIVRVFLAVS